MQYEQSLSSEIEGEVVMINLESSAYYGLNLVGSRIWALITHPISIGELCSILQVEYEVDAETCQKEVMALVQNLLNEQLAQIVPA